jgi:predicted amidohydrolase
VTHTVSFIAVIAFAASAAVSPSPAASGPVGAPEGWKTAAPRDEIKPLFSYEPKGGRSAHGAFVIATDGREGLDGYWFRSFSVEGGKYYSFLAYRKTTGVAVPRQSALVRIKWLDDRGEEVKDDRKLVERYLNNFNATAPPEFPTDKGTDAAGWTEVSDTHQAPGGARQAVVELHLQWAPKGRILWSDVSFTAVSPPSPRKVRLASIHFRPREGKSPERNRRLFAPLIEEAARRGADLVVLPETLTFYGTGKTFAEVAEPVPGPSTEYFGELAKKHNLYIVAGLVERNGHLVHNVAALLAPDGSLAGKYRKITLPDGEVEAGIAPGHEYPVFQTRFGKLGIMICYDGFFPEVARELTKRGAEVIAWPVWGCNPELTRARAAENHTYLVSSTYEDISSNWMLTAVWDHAGRTIASAKDFGTVILAEVDLNEHTRWRSLGDFRSKIPRHAPVVPPEQADK